VAAVAFAFAHLVLTFFPLSNKYGWAYFSVHWITLALGAVVALWLLILVALSFRRAAARIGTAAWHQIQQGGVVVLPLIVVHYLVLGKTGKWLEWFSGKDPHPGPPGTLIGTGIALVVLALRGADWAARAAAQTSNGQGQSPAPVSGTPGANEARAQNGHSRETSSTKETNHWL
jgi:DMSO/TMAO reductase YedYZ heme-binding membrane subunit